MTNASGNAASYFVDRHVVEGRAGKVAFREVGTGRCDLLLIALNGRFCQGFIPQSLGQGADIVSPLALLTADI